MMGQNWFVKTNATIRIPQLPILVCLGQSLKLFVLFFFVSDIEVACYGYEGIDAVKDALRAGLGCSTENMPIKVRLSFI